jgi:CxxC motif-containing protein (DUF1111 family)
MAFFNQTKDTFQEVDSVSGKLPGEAGAGLGPRFNMNSCSGCHAFPAVGGSSPQNNPQIAVATLHGADNEVPSFILPQGPVREARFIKNPDGTPDGGVHDLFVITGRTDAGTCNISQPDFKSALAANNVIFRIPTPTFGAGLIAAIPDSTIISNRDANAGAKADLGISGRENRTGNDGTITRFGWKAQNKSLVIFAGEAYNVEQGVTNEVFPNERDETTGCVLNGIPEDHTQLTSDPTKVTPSDVVQFASFMNLSAPPQPAQGNFVTQAGAANFQKVGCALCHTPQLKTGPSAAQALSNVNANLYSDLLVHNMGSGLADQISQGSASGNEFRTAPLWGVGQRIFFLHDGRTSDLLQAINSHAGRGSEANSVIGNFNQLSRFDQESILVFLRSL